MSDPKKVYTTSNGCPVLNPMEAQQFGRPGPLVLQDHHLIDMLAHFDRERIPERVVHAKGWGAHGEFEVTDDVTDINGAAFLRKVGTKVKTLTRFSTVAGEKGSADTNRDPRGFSTKLYTEEGVMDWVYNNTPVFFIRNPIKFPYFIHSQKRDPQTGLRDNEMQWDYWVNNQETIHQLMQLFSDRGTPASFRHMHGYSGHAYKWVNAKGEWVYVQIHLETDQGIKTFTNDEAGKIAGENPDYHGQELFEAIEKGDFPSWTAYVQTMTEEQAKNEKRFSVFDLTKVWPKKDYPLRRFGKLTLNKNPENYFAEIEQAAFSPAHVVPGWEPSADPVLQSRLFSYSDTHRHRLGVNYQQIPVNKPLNSFNPFQRDGSGTVDSNYGSLPNYPTDKCPVTLASSVRTNEVRGETWPGTISHFHWSVDESQPQEYEQAAALWRVLGRTPGQQENFVSNVAGHLSAATPNTQDKVFSMFSVVDKDLGQKIKTATLKLSPRDSAKGRL